VSSCSKERSTVISTSTNDVLKFWHDCGFLDKIAKFLSLNSRKTLGHEENQIRKIYTSLSTAGRVRFFDIQSYLDVSRLTELATSNWDLLKDESKQDRAQNINEPYWRQKSPHEIFHDWWVWFLLSSQKELYWYYHRVNCFSYPFLTLPNPNGTNQFKAA